MLGGVKVSVAVVAVATLLAGCKSQDIKPADQDALLRGVLAVSQGQYWFESCLGGERLAVAALPEVLEQAYRRQSLGDDWPVYVEAFGRIEASHVELSRGVVLGGGARACQFGLDGIELRGVSEDGMVVFDLTRDQIRVRFRDRLMHLAFERPEPEAADIENPGPRRHWKQQMQSSNRRHKVSLSVAPEACTGPRGGWYGMSMEADVNGRYFKGCARLGDLSHWPLRERYTTLPSIATRRIDLMLMPDGSLVWREDYLNDQPLLEHDGHWRRVSGDRIELSLDGQGSGPALVFSVSPNGELNLAAYHPAYGNELTLAPAAGPMRYDSGELDWWR